MAWRQAVNVWHTWATPDPAYRQHRTADEDRIRETLGVRRDTYTAADPLTVPDDCPICATTGHLVGEPPSRWHPGPYATVDDSHPEAVIVWLAGAITAALLVFVAVVVMRRG